MRCLFAVLTLPMLTALAADLPSLKTTRVQDSAVAPAAEFATPTHPITPARRDAKAEFRIERRPLMGGSELLTVFGHMPDALVESEASSVSANREAPLIAVLRDTLGDNIPENDRLRYVWILTSSGPTLLQRMAAATPFYYWRAGIGKNPDRVPSPVLDLSATATPVWTGMAGTIAQMTAFDLNGAIIRSSTRSYRNNARDHRQLHLLEGLAVLSQLEETPQAAEHLSEREMLTIQARLGLANQTFGGLVSEANLRDAYMNQRTSAMEDRGHNWELLRQRAEANGLYFEPFGLNGTATQALLLVAKEDLNGQLHPFDGRFLNIRDPFRDPKLRNWTGYTQTKDLGDGKGSVELIPLALYSLDHPKVPLLLADFRNTLAPKWREMTRHAIVDGVTGVIGYSRWGNWPYFAGTMAWNFIQTRHGVANDRAARIRGYSQVRQWIALDPAIDPALRAEMQKRLETLGVNPLEDNIANKAKFAWRQYQALVQYCNDPNGLAARVDRARDAEVVALDHGLAARAGLQAIHYVSFGAYTHHEENSILLQTRLDQARRARGAHKALAIAPHEDR